MLCEFLCPLWNYSFCFVIQFDQFSDSISLISMVRLNNFGQGSEYVHQEVFACSITRWWLGGNRSKLSFHEGVAQAGGSGWRGKELVVVRPQALARGSQVNIFFLFAPNCCEPNLKWIIVARDTVEIDQGVDLVEGWLEDISSIAGSTNP